MQTWLSFLVFLSSFSCLSRTNAFTPAVGSPQHFSKSLLQASRDFFGDKNNNNNKDDKFDLEAVRTHLESLLSESYELQPDGGAGRRAAQMSPRTAYAHSTTINVPLPPIAPLTTMERVRREKEIELLQQLNQGDAVLSDLWTLWFQERGPKAAAQLRKAEDLTLAGPHGWKEAESILRDLVETHGIGWAEPVHRLATLHYMQGRLEDAEKFCKMVLAVKPWHFGALSGIVMIYAGLHDNDAARKWAARRLPTFSPNGPNRRRIAWVRQADLDARGALSDAEARLIEHLGGPDDMENRLAVDKDAWL